VGKTNSTAGPSIRDMRISIVIPAYNAERTIPSLLESLCKQISMDSEIIVVDDGSSDGTSQIVRSYGCTLVEMERNRGPAHCRNVGARVANGEILAFTDSDCIVERNWLERIQKRFSQNHTKVLMGRLVLLPSSFLGDSISGLGFPAGGSIGFDKIWRVDERGFTESLSSCNCAIRKDLFWEVGGFDESFPYPGGEDSLLAYNLRKRRYGIRYCPDVLVYHEARDSFQDFLRWQFRRGVSSYIFSTKISDKKAFLSLRLWSTKNILRTYFRDKKFPLVFFLLAMSFLVQAAGFLSGKYRR
jgi:glycosyltransferase involved in cell wall biosynthesis